MSAVRERLPSERPGLNHKFSVGGHEGYIRVGVYPDGRPGEIFIKMSKTGSYMSGLVDAFATAISIGLQFGIPLQTFANKFRGARFEPLGFTGNPEIPEATSVLDYLFTWLSGKYSQEQLCEPETSNQDINSGNGSSSDD